MQAVILAAGKSTRTYPLTITKPKPLLKAANKTLLEHNLENLSKFVNEAIVVVGYKKNLIEKHIGNKYKNLKIKYVEQKRQSGTGNALLTAEKHIKNGFISLYGDDIYSREDFKSTIRNRYSVLTRKVKNPEIFGVILKKNNILTGLVEKPQRYVSNLANTGLYKLDKKIFAIIKKLKKSKRNEYELTDAIRNLSKREKVCCVNSRNWLPICYPWDLLYVDRVLRKNKNSIGKNVRISGKIHNSSIGDGCIIEGSVKNSIVMDGTIIDKSSVVEDSIIGENVHFSGIIKAKNNAFSMIKGKNVKAGRMGAIIGDNCEVANARINAGCKVWPDKIITGNVTSDVE